MTNTELIEKCKRLQMAVTALVIPFQQAVRETSPEIWVIFLRDCMSKKQRYEKGWLLPEEEGKNGHGQDRN